MSSIICRYHLVDTHCFYISSKNVVVVYTFLFFRKTCIAGAIVSSISIFLSTFSPNVYLLMISYGVLGGFGLGLMYVPAVTAVGYWFEKKRSLVTGISTCGSGFGTIVFAPLVTALEAGLGWQWCNRIVAGLCLAVSDIIIQKQD